MNIDKSEKFTWLVRLGYAARGLVYILLGYLALSTAGKAGEGQAAVFDLIQDVPLGTPLLYLVALGLLAYALSKLLDAATDLEHHGRDAAGKAKRVGSAASGVAHLALAYTAYQFATGAQNRSAGDSGGQEHASSLLTWEMGWVLLGVIGLGFLVAGVFQAKSAYDAHFMQRISGRAPHAVRTIGRIGHAARAVVFVIIGWSLVQAGWLEQSSEVKGLGAAIMALSNNGAIYSFVAVGLILFGIFSLIAARYRVIPNLEGAALNAKLSH